MGTHAHVESKHQQQRFEEHDLEGPPQHSSQSDTPMCVLPFECRGIPLVASLLSDGFRLPDQEYWRVCFGNNEDGEKEAEAGKHGKDPEDPAPGDTRYFYVPASQGAERWSSKRGDNKDCHSSTTGIVIPSTTVRRNEQRKPGCHPSRKRNVHVCQDRSGIC